MKCLVTGATGFIGYNLVQLLLQEEQQVTCLIRQTSDLRWLNSLGTVKYVHGDITSPESLPAAVKEAEWIFHMAGLTTAVNREGYFQVNHLGTRNILDAIGDHCQDPKRFILISSLEAAGPTTIESPLTESDPPQPISHYGESKRAAELATLDYREQFPVTIIRPPIVYGPLDVALHPFFQLISRGWQLNLTGRDLYLSLIYVKDLVRAALTLAESDSPSGEMYYVSDRYFYSVNQLQAIIADVLETSTRRIPVPRSLLYPAAFLSEVYIKLFRKPSFLNYQKIKVVNQSAWICRSDKIAEEAGYQPDYSLADGAGETIEWYRNHGWL
mgnify:CR=1 FL=1